MILETFLSILTRQGYSERLIRLDADAKSGRPPINRRVENNENKDSLREENGLWRKSKGGMTEWN
jgi:hypothetical protein